MSTAYIQYMPISNTQTNAIDYTLINQQQNEQYMTKMYTAFVQAQQSQAITKKHLVFFDWDDTIFPTTTCIRNNQVIPDAELEVFGKAAYELLLNFINVYSAENIYIVTNGVSGWVKKSLKIMSARQTSGIDYWAAIYQLFATTLAGHVISARTMYETAYPGQPTAWKTLVFQQIAIEHFGANFHGESTIISIGDSSDEFIASMETKKMLSTQYGVDPVHLIRMPLKRRPSFDSMFKQFAAITAVVPELNRMEPNSLDINIADLV